MILVVAVLVLRTSVVRTFYIPSASMEPTLQIGDRIVVNELSYDLHGVHPATSWCSRARRRRTAGPHRCPTW